MNNKSLSIKKIYLGIGCIAMLAVIVFPLSIYYISNDVRLTLISLSYAAVIFLLILLCMYLLRKKISIFSNEICRTIDDMMNCRNEPIVNTEEETLLSRISLRLSRLYGILQENRHQTAKEKEDLQELISDISHQVKTPIANLKMVNSTLMSRTMTKDEQKYFLQAMEGQLNKLDFLMQSMIKTSRLEAGIITLVQNHDKIYDTIAEAMGGVLILAEKKQMNMTIDCDQNLIVHHDKKWTAEAIFNILENAVKYTNTGGNITVNVERQEMYTKIEISDNGKGISESRQAKIFKRFYREPEVQEFEGSGLGLYLARKIISMQCGYIMVNSEIQKGSTFSIFLLNN